MTQLHYKPYSSHLYKSQGRLTTANFQNRSMGEFLDFFPENEINSLLYIKINANVIVNKYNNLIYIYI